MVSKETEKGLVTLENNQRERGVTNSTFKIPRSSDKEVQELYGTPICLHLNITNTSPKLLVTQALNLLCIVFLKK